MSKIRLELSDWLYNSGIVGLVKILNHSDAIVSVGLNYVEFEEEELIDFENKYFDYFSYKYEKLTSWYKLVSFEEYLDNMESCNISEKNLEIINNYIEDLKKKLTSNSYKSAYLLIKNEDIDILLEEKKIQKIKKSKNQNITEIYQEIEEAIKHIKRVIDFLRKEEVKRIIKAKNIIYDIIQNFWSDVSFLNKNNSKNDMFTEYVSYFLNPAIKYSNADKIKYKYECFTCNNKIATLSKPNAYDLTWLTKIGVDMSRKSSHFWNLNGFSYICPLCNLVYSCVPAGFSVIMGRGIFINENSSMLTMISINELSLDKGITFEELEEQGYFNIVDSMEQNQISNSDKEIENIQIVKFNSQNQRRPYTFNLLSKRKLHVIYKNKNRLKALLKINIKISKDYYINLYKEVLQRIYDNKNQFDLINELIYLNLQDKFRGLRYIYYIIQINNNIIGGVDKRMAYIKEIDKFKDYGLKLRNFYINGNSSAKNKLPGITYRLLNALKTKNTSKFMETLISSYMYLNKQVPTDFINGLKDIERFQSIGYSFLIGLLGEEENDNKILKGEEAHK
ncbi:type I-B CRISPR-associated protein Cas8b1/Cst1 [Clostridium sp. 19966]|uniref:type I-B CRISPR-associated protein Cas8b1/Cst1 n=1 Tax=Clostridium sp. 19966 TaxID=2768166 RepID=UPI0028E00DB5|nr:type I-B CRISPR-associated protein Cas8b1/Cst1 [Clostridium sp. 19966]MDT8719674.1 type I-B CRISPR-associated protein Cas8b1/Cst1 [Clostridium sp. 19966]